MSCLASLPNRTIVFEHAWEMDARGPDWTMHHAGGRRADRGRKEDARRRT